VDNLFQGWDGIPALLPYLVPPLIDPKLAKLLGELRGTSDLALYDALMQRCH
jgi:hypothetical protein